MQIVSTHRLTFVSLLLVALLGVIACGSSSTISAGATPTATMASTATPIGPIVTVPIARVTMFSATTSWGETTAPVTYTIDGGHTWYDVTPSGLTPPTTPNALDLYARSTQEAWAWTTFLTSGGSFTLWHTTDAGVHWTKNTVALRTYSENGIRKEGNG